MLLRLLLGFLLATVLVRLFGRLFGSPSAPPTESPRAKRARADLDPRRKVKAEWSEIEREDETPDE